MKTPVPNPSSALRCLRNSKLFKHLHGFKEALGKKMDRRQPLSSGSHSCRDRGDVEKVRGRGRYFKFGKCGGRLAYRLP
jgi:hypothetical protein